VHLFSFGIIFHRGVTRQNASFRITGELIPAIYKYGEEIKILDKITALAKTNTLKRQYIITDKIGRIGRSESLVYYATCKTFPNAPVCKFYSFNDPSSFRKSATEKEKRDKFLAKRLEYYITLKMTKFGRMDNDNRILELVQKSGLFEEVSSPECPSLVIYRYKKND
jgi:hypothetical protein